MLVLDEPTKCLIWDLSTISAKSSRIYPKSVKPSCFSATMPEAIAKLAKQELKDPEHIHLASKEESHNDIEQALYVIRHTERQIALLRLLEAENPSLLLFFARVTV